jgi:hypothetical protein
MAEVKNVKAPGRWFPRSIAGSGPRGGGRLEPEIDPYAGRFFGDQVDYELEDSEFDRMGGHGLFSF